MRAEDFTKEEMKCLKEAASVLEKLTYEVMLNHFKREIEIQPSEHSKNIYSMIANKETWELLRDIQAQNRLQKRYFRK
jgi:hypothetical protein